MINDSVPELRRKIRRVKADIQQVAAYPDKQEFVTALQQELAELVRQLDSQGQAA